MRIQDSRQDSWTVVLPVKGGPAAKSRLGGLASHGRLDVATTTALALAMAIDCVEAVLRTPDVGSVLVVTGDPDVGRSARELGAVVVHQPDEDPGLAAAVKRGVAAASRGPTAVLLADLPSLRPDDLQAALSAARDACSNGAGWVFVPDARGDGTVALAALDAAALRPSFGPGSAAAHAAAGARSLALDLPRLRQDVDTLEDLRHAVRLVVGPRTARTLAGVQATVLSWDPAERSGEVVTDAGVRLPMARNALDGSGLRHLRPGQRVTCAAGATGAGGEQSGPVTQIRIHGIEG